MQNSLVFQPFEFGNTNTEPNPDVNELNKDELNEMVDIMTDLIEDLGAYGIRIERQTTQNKPSSFRIC